MPYDNLHEYYGPDNRRPRIAIIGGSTNPNQPRHRMAAALMMAGSCMLG
jgi:predicted CoA-binding protein